MWWYVQGDQCVFNWDSIVWEYDRWEGVEGISKEQTYIYLIPWHFALWEYKGTDNRQDRVQVQVFPPLFLYSGRACIWLATHSPKLLISEIESKMFHNKKVQSSIILSVRGQFIFIAVILSQERTIDSVFDHSLCEAILSMKNSNRAVFLFFPPSGWRNRGQSTQFLSRKWYLVLSWNENTWTVGLNFVVDLCLLYLQAGKTFATAVKICVTNKRKQTANAKYKGKRYSRTNIHISYHDVLGVILSYPIQSNIVQNRSNQITHQLWVICALHLYEIMSQTECL